MDERTQAVNAMIRVLRRSDLCVPAATKFEMLHVLQKYTITREEPSKGNMQTQIEHFIAAKAVDGLSPNTLKEYRYRLSAFARHVDCHPNRINTDDLRDYLSGVVS